MACASIKPQRQRECQAYGERDRGRDGCERLLPVAPRQEFQRQDAQPAGEMRGEEQHQAPFRELDERLPGPGGARADPRGAFERLAERPEVHGKEQRERDSRDAVHQKSPVRGVVVRHAKTAITARMPIQAMNMANSASAMSREAPRHPNHSENTLLRPIGAGSAAESTKTE